MLITPPDISMTILRRLLDAGHRTCFVGGCVRDALLGRVPKDWDIATSATPDQIEALFDRTVPVGKAFGVIVVVAGGTEHEVATFRGDGAYSDGRRPDTVRFCDAEEDVRRRDFTVNALLYDPVEDRIIDWVGGRRDLEQRRIRTVGKPDERFAEDRLRMLRAVRFAARLGFDIDPDTATAIRRHAAEIAAVSAERIGAELVGMLAEGTAASALDLLDTTGLLTPVLPDVARLKDTPQPPEFHPEGDVFVHTRDMLAILDNRIRGTPCGPRRPGIGTGRDDAPGPGKTPTPRPPAGFTYDDAIARETMAWTVLLHDVGKPGTIAFADRIRFHGHDEQGADMAQRILRGLRRPNRTVNTVAEVIRRHMRFSHLPNMRVARRRRALNDPLFPFELELHLIDCAGSHGKLRVYDFALDEWRREQQRPEPMRPLLRGDDIVRLGIPPGPAVGALLRTALDLQLEQTLTTRDEALAWAAAAVKDAATNPDTRLHSRR